jgi:hypothetical protein
VLHRVDGRLDTAVEAATEALDLYLAGGPRLLANRVDPRADLLANAAVCCTELAIIAVERGSAEHAARLLGHADRLRRDAGVAIPGFQSDDLDRAVADTSRLLGADTFRAEFGEGQQGQLGRSVAFKP